MDWLLKTLLAVVANRKRCHSAFWRNPTAYKAHGRVLRSSIVFHSSLLA
jgi:hypothetical protein